MALLGAGLTGVVFGRVVIERGLVGFVSVFDPGAKAMDIAVAEGAAHEAAASAAAAVAGADLVALAMPITATKLQLTAVLDMAQPGAIVTDFGRTKAEIVALAEAHPRVASGEIFFVGGDPLVTRRALMNYRDPAEVFESAACFLCNTATTNPAQLGRLVQLWQAIGAQVVVARPHRHDKLVSWTEQLQLIAASACMLALEDAGEDQNLVRGVAGAILRDVTTHVKDINIEQFDDVLNANRDNLRTGLRTLRGVLEKFEANLENLDALHDMLDSAATFRKHLDVLPTEKQTDECAINPSEEK